MAALPQTVSELFPRQWLKAEDLSGRAVTVKILAVDVEELRQPNGERKAAAVLRFARTDKRLILNKTQCGALAAICGSERLADWQGHSVQLTPATAPNGKPTIAILAAPGQDEGAR